MRRQRLSLLLILLVLSIGFAAVTTNLILNGNTRIGIGDFEVYSTNVEKFVKRPNDAGDFVLSSDRKTITFTTDTFSSVGDFFVLEYDVYNASLDYDADVTFKMNILSGEELKDKIKFEVVQFTDDDSFSLIQENDTILIPADESKHFALFVGLQEPVLEDSSIEIAFTYDAEPVERTVHVNESVGRMIDSYLELEPGLYTLDKQLTKTWQELEDEGVIYVNNGTLSTNLEIDDSSYFHDVVNKGTLSNSLIGEELSVTLTEEEAYNNAMINYYSNRNSSCGTLYGMLVIDESVNNIDTNSLTCSGLKVVVLKDTLDDSIYDNIGALFPKSVLFVKSLYNEEMINEGYAQGCYSAINPLIIGDYAVDPNDDSRLLAYLGDETNITIPDSFTSISIHPFLLSDVQNVTIPNSVTEISTGALMGVKNVIYHGTATYEDDDPYWKANSLNSVVNGDFIIGGENNDILIGYVGSSKNVVVPEGIKEIGSKCFYGLILNNVTLPSTLEKIDSMAFAFTNISRLSVPSSVTQIGDNAFYLIKYLDYDGTASYDESARYWGARYINATEENGFIIGGNNRDTLYKYTGNSRNIIIPNTVKIIDDNVFRDISLNSVVLPDGLTTIGKYAFAYTGLSIIDVPDTVTSIKPNAFLRVFIINYNGSATYTATNSNWGASYLNCDLNDLFVLSDDGKTLIEYIGSATAPAVPNGITTIGDRAFASKAIHSVTIPDSVTTIGEYAFADCLSSFTGVLNVPNSVTSIGYHAFYRNYNVNYSGTATYSNDDPYWGAKMMNGGYTEDHLIYSDSSKTKLVYHDLNVTGANIVIPNTVVELEENALSNISPKSITLPESLRTIGDYAFEYCRLNSVLVIPSNVETIGTRAFRGVRAVEYNGGLTDSNNWGAIAFNAYIENNAAYSDSSKTILLSFFGSGGTYTVADTVTTIKNGAFNYISLSGLNIPDNVTTIESGAFAFGSLGRLVLPRTITTVSSSLLNYCYASEIVLPDTLTEIKSGTFNYTRVKKITIPASVTTIGTGLFSYYSNVTSVTFENTEGWTVTKNNQTTNIDSSQLTNPTSAFNLLKNTYSSYTWSRS